MHSVNHEHMGKNGKLASETRRPNCRGPNSTRRRQDVNFVPSLAAQNREWELSRGVLEGLSVPQNRNRRKIAAFANRKVQIASFAAEIAKTAQENRCDFLGRGEKLQRFCVFTIAAFSGR